MRTLLLLANTALLLAIGAAAQQAAATSGATVPRLVRVANTFRPAAGPASPVESVTLSIYKEEQGGTAVWRETQNVAVDAEGRYTTLMGSTLPDGVPADLFSTGESRWLGVQFNRPGEAEQPRVQLVSVPYALRAADAETLGGKPASAYLLAPGAVAYTDSPGEAKSAGTRSAPSIKGATPQVNSGIPNCIGMFTNSTDLSCSVIWQNGINIGIDTMNPSVALDLGAGSLRVANYSAPSSGAGLEMAYIPAKNSGYLFAYDRSAAAPKDLNLGGSGAAMTIKAAGNVGIGATSPAYNLDVAGDINLTGVVRINGTQVLPAPDTQPVTGTATLSVCPAGSFTINSLTLATSTVTSGGITGVTNSDITVQKPFDGCSPKLLQLVASGQHVTSMTLTMPANGFQTPYQIQLTDVVFTRDETDNSTSTPMETIGIAYASKTVTGPTTTTPSGGTIQVTGLGCNFAASSWSLNETNPVSGTGKVNFGTLNLSKQADSCSSLLLAALNSQMSFNGTVTITWTPAGASSPLEEIDLTDVAIAADNVSGSFGTIGETVSLTFKTIELSSFQPNGKIQAGWNLATNTAQ